MSKEERWARVQDRYENTAVDGSVERKAIAAAGITCRDVMPVYFSRDPYHKAFEERLDCGSTAPIISVQGAWSSTRQERG